LTGGAFCNDGQNKNIGNFRAKSKPQFFLDFGKRNPHRTPLLIHGKTGGDAVLTWWQQHLTYVYARLYQAHSQKNWQSREAGLKLARFFKEQIWAVILFFQTPEELTPQKLLEQIFYHCVYDTRNNRHSYTEKIAVLS
jgi:hypothetical protein